MDYEKQIAFNRTEYTIIQKSLQYYIQSLPFTERISTRKIVEPLLAGSNKFKITKNISDIIIKAVNKFRKFYAHNHNLSGSLNNIIRTILHKMDIYVDTWNKLHPSTKTLQNDLSYVFKLHQQHQDRKALDLLFKDLNLGKHGYYCTSCFSNLGLQALYAFNRKSVKVQFCVLKLLLSGVKVTETQYQIPVSLINQLKHFQKLNKHYLVGKVDFKTGNINLKPLTFVDSSKFLACVKAVVHDYIKNSK